MSQERALARVNVAAMERNCARLRAELGGRSELCAVVKAGGYGHGALESARASLAGGASWLAVATADEAVELRARGLEEPRLLVMGALTEAEMARALAARADLVVWREEQLGQAARSGGGRVHVKLDSGMGRLGTRDQEEASRVVEGAVATPGVELAGVMTHFATADDPGDGFFEVQLRSFASWAGAVKAAHPDVLVHAANSAATLRDRSSHFDMVRCGVAIYGMDPANADPLARGLEPALELRSYVAEVKPCGVGQSAGYGRMFVAREPTCLGVLPIGYGDGYRWGLSGNAEVLIDGRRYPLAGRVSMDNVTIDLGAEPTAEGLRGREAVLIGVSGEERITAEQLAGRLGTINYEITCGLSSRVRRSYSRDDQPLEDEGQNFADEGQPLQDDGQALEEPSGGR
jgi:alanine racemase